MMYSQTLFRNKDEAEVVQRQFLKIDFLVFAAFQFIYVNLLPAPDITLCAAVYNILGRELKTKYGVDIFDDGRAMEIYNVLCRVYTVVNAVLIEFMTKPTTTRFDIAHLVRLSRHMVATHQIAVLDFSTIFPYKFFDKNEARVFQVLLEVNGVVRKSIVRAGAGAEGGDGTEGAGEEGQGEGQVEGQGQGQGRMVVLRLGRLQSAPQFQRRAGGGPGQGPAPPPVQRATEAQFVSPATNREARAQVCGLVEFPRRGRRSRGGRVLCGASDARPQARVERGAARAKDLQRAQVAQDGDLRDQILVYIMKL